MRAARAGRRTPSGGGCINTAQLVVLCLYFFIKHVYEVKWYSYYNQIFISETLQKPIGPAAYTSDFREKRQEHTYGRTFILGISPIRKISSNRLTDGIYKSNQSDQSYLTWRTSAIEESKQWRRPWTATAVRRRSIPRTTDILDLLLAAVDVHDLLRRISSVDRSASTDPCFIRILVLVSFQVGRPPAGRWGQEATSSALLERALQSAAAGESCHGPWWCSRAAPPEGVLRRPALAALLTPSSSSFCRYPPHSQNNQSKECRFSYVDWSIEL
jgi:hypothetical protein